MPNTQGVPASVLPDGALLPQDPSMLSDQIGSAAFDQISSALQTSGNALADWYRRGGIAGSLGMVPIDEQLLAAATPANRASDALNLNLSNPMLWALAPGVMIGEKGAANLANLRATADQAKLLERLGTSPNDINLLTNWFRMPTDKKWRYVVSDAPARLRPEMFPTNPKDPSQIRPQIPLTLGQALEHPDLFAAHPEMANYPVKYETFPGVSGSFYPNTRSIGLAGGQPEKVLSALLHETQHGIQQLEGFEMGGQVRVPPDFHMRAAQLNINRARFLEQMKEMHPELSPGRLAMIEDALRGGPLPPASIIDPLHPDLKAKLGPLIYEAGALKNQSATAYDKYRRLAGEVEARAVQEQLARGDWTTPIWQHMGYIPFSQQIVKTPVNHDPFVKPRLSLVPIDHDPFGAQ